MKTDFCLNDFTLTRPFPGVNSAVLNKAGASTEGFPTLTTWIRPFPGVNSLMFNKGSPLAKGLSTLATLIRPSSGMYSLMLRKTVALPEEFSTVSPLVGPFPSVAFPQCEFSDADQVWICSQRPSRIPHTHKAFLLCGLAGV